MHNDLWDVIYQYLAAQTRIYHKFANLDFEQQLTLLTVADDIPADPAVLSLKVLNVELCEILQQCKDSMALLLDEERTHLVVGILAIVCDETVLTKQMSKIQIPQGSLDKYSRTTAELKLTAKWPKLQRQFAQSNNGGEHFFDNLDMFLSQPREFQFLIELCYFCLTQGFRGKHLERLDALDIYKDRCINKLTEPSHFSATDDRNKGKKTNKYGHVLRNQNATST